MLDFTPYFATFIMALLRQLSLCAVLLDAGHRNF
jgi:hypothetical protein